MKLVRVSISRPWYPIVGIMVIFKPNSLLCSENPGLSMGSLYLFLWMWIVNGGSGGKVLEMGELLLCRADRT